MPTIFDNVSAKNIAAYYSERVSNRIPYLGETLFPAKKQLGLDLSWIKGANGLPVALMPSAFDTKATLRDRIGFKEVQTEMPFFREAMQIGEKDRQQLNTLAASNADAMVKTVVNKIFDDVTTLVDGATVQPERMRMQLLSTGTIAIVANRQDYTYDYKMSEDHKEELLMTAKWSDTANSTPIQDITKWQDTVEDDTGERPTRAILTRKTWNYLMENKSIKLDMNPIGGQNVILTDSMLRQYLEAKTGVTFAVYNKKYIAEDGTTKNFYPDDHITLIPGSGTLGNTYYGTTPEESDLMTGSTNADVRIVNTGVAITTIKEAHPVNVQTIVSEIVLPSFENLDKIFIAKVS
ncbi:major capsid protein [Metabacillus fastidiosus]|uniref:major capsid protein n=1 Tax=Metabacillus fastidiosus TaxID=1458 RepID=UPI000825CB05|nr:major capsid protein [Metabacillus fastidiosus]MED4461856.1 major capsid protein [Metabacillus fastidiosus]